MSVSHDLPKWPTPPSFPLMPAPPIPSGVGFGLFVAGFAIPTLRLLAPAVTVGIKAYNDSTYPQRKAKHEALIARWAKAIKPVEILHASSHDELDKALTRFRTGLVGPGSHIIVTGSYTKGIIETHDAFCEHYAARQDERVKVFGHVVKVTALTAAVAASPIGGSAKAAAYAFISALPASFKGRDKLIKTIHEIESEHIAEAFDLIEVAVSTIGGMVHNRWNDRRLMAKVSATLVKEILFNGATFTDNDGDSFLIKWGEVVGHKTV